jgi:hypothetical protein
MIYTANPSLAVRPKTFYGVGMSVSQNVDFLSVGNCVMLVSHRGQCSINSKLVSMYHRFFGNICANNWENGFSFDIGNCASFEFPVSLNDTKYSSLILRATPALAAFVLSTKITLVNLYIASKRAVVLVKALSYFVAHTPSGFVSNSRFSLNLFGRDTATGLSHQVDHIKPSGQWSAGFVKDRVGSWADLETAEVTSEGLAPLYSMKQSVLFALWAINSFWVFFVSNVIKANVIIREHLKKVIESEFLHRGFDFLSFLSHRIPALLDVVGLITNYSIAGLLLDVKGYSPLIIYDEGAFDGFEKKEIPEGRKECEKCLGYGGWNATLDAYGVGKHSKFFCSGCLGQGSVDENLEEYPQDKLKRVKEIFDGKLVASGRQSGYAHFVSIVTLTDMSLIDFIDNEILKWCADNWWLLNFGGVVKRLNDTEEGYAQWSVKVYTD